jgi:hypothetical protein
VEDDRGRRAGHALGWVHWHNTGRLHGYLGDVPPAEFEAAFYAAQQPAPAGSETNNPSLHQTQRGSSALRYAPPMGFCLHLLISFPNLDKRVASPR